MLKQKITLNSFERQVLLDAAAILGRIPEDQAEPFGLFIYSDFISLKDQAENLCEMVGWSDGTIQYEQRIGPAPKPVHVSREELNRSMLNALIHKPIMCKIIA